jgi:hypothetical protein
MNEPEWQSFERREARSRARLIVVVAVILAAALWVMVETWGRF